MARPACSLCLLDKLHQALSRTRVPVQAVRCFGDWNGSSIDGHVLPNEIK